MQEKHRPSRNRLSRRASMCVALSVALPTVFTASAAYAATGPVANGTTYYGVVGYPFASLSLDSQASGGTTPYTWSIPTINGQNTSVVGSVYSGSTASSATVTGQVYGIPVASSGGSGMTVAQNVYSHPSSVMDNVYLLPDGVKIWANGNFEGAPSVAGTISFNGVVIDHSGVRSTPASYSLTVQSAPSSGSPSTSTSPPPSTGTSSSTGTSPTTTTTTTTTTAPSSSNPFGTQTFQSKVSTSAFSLALTSAAVTSAGGTVSTHTTNSSITVTVPANAFTTSENVTVNQAPAASLVGGAPTGQLPIAAFGLGFSGAAPTAPVTLSITNKGIPASALVYQVSSSGVWAPIPATVNNGRLSVSVTGAQDIVIANPQLPSASRQVLWNGQRVEVAHGFVAKDPVHGNMTTFMPIWYLMQVLKAHGITSTWNGKVWKISTTGSTFTPNLSNVNVGQGTDQIEINGQLVQNAYGQVAVDPAHGNKTTYMPIFWVFQALSHVGLQSRWNGASWSITPAASASSNSATSTS